MNFDKSKFHEEFRINSARYIYHNYNAGIFFITTCTKDRKYHFGQVVMDDGVLKMQLSEIGLCAKSAIENISLHYKYALVPAYVIMPNHIHLIIGINYVEEGVQTEHTFPLTPCTDGACSVSPQHHTSPLTPCTDGACSVSPQHHTSPLTPCTDGACSVSPNNEINLQMQNISLKKGKLSDVVGSFKAAVTKYAHEHKIPFAWLPRFYDCIIRNQSELYAYIHYIGYNVINWGTDEFNNDAKK